MKTKTLIIALSLSIGFLTACTDKKNTESNTETEVIAKDSKKEVESTIDKDEKRRLDSIRQVKEHGHAH